MRIPRDSRRPLLVVVGVTLSLILSGCASGPGDGPAEQPDPFGDVVEEEVRVPDEWPDSLPLPPGTPYGASALNGTVTYGAVVDEQQVAAAVAYADTISAAGFELLSESDITFGQAPGHVWAFTDGTYHVEYLLEEQRENGGLEPPKEGGPQTVTVIIKPESNTMKPESEG